ncbi:MAG: anion permease [Solirubrobacterales bacterium]
MFGDISVVLILIVVIALAFDFVNGFHDTANVIATSVSTRALSPRNAILLATVFNFVGALTGTAVAKTIGKGIVPPENLAGAHAGTILIAALLGAITWNLITWYFGIPSSSSHALIGGLTGASVSALGFSSIEWGGFVKILIALVTSPIAGLLFGSLVMLILFWIFRESDPHQLNKRFLMMQVLTAISMSWAHGSNDAQKSMGIITLAILVSGGATAAQLGEFAIPTWVIMACAAAMAGGTMLGGWRIIRTMGAKIFRLEPINGFAADFTSASVIFAATSLGLPVSTTHVVASSIMGVGMAKRFRGVRWDTARQIVMAWAITIPASALVGAVMFQLVHLVMG